MEGLEADQRPRPVGLGDEGMRHAFGAEGERAGRERQAPLADVDGELPFDHVTPGWTRPPSSAASAPRTTVARFSSSSPRRAARRWNELASTTGTRSNSTSPATSPTPTQGADPRTREGKRARPPAPARAHPQLELGGTPDLSAPAATAQARPPRAYPRTSRVVLTGEGLRPPPARATTRLSYRALLVGRANPAKRGVSSPTRGDGAHGPAAGERESQQCPFTARAGAPSRL